MTTSRYIPPTEADWDAADAELNAEVEEMRNAPDHVDYPHEPGTLFDCAACEPLMDNPGCSCGEADLGAPGHDNHPDHVWCGCENSACDHGYGTCSNNVDQFTFTLRYVGGDICQACVDTMRQDAPHWVILRDQTIS